MSESVLSQDAVGRRLHAELNKDDGGILPLLLSYVQADQLHDHIRETWGMRTNSIKTNVRELLTVESGGLGHSEPWTGLVRIDQCAALVEERFTFRLKAAEGTQDPLVAASDFVMGLTGQAREHLTSRVGSLNRRGEKIVSAAARLGMKPNAFFTAFTNFAKATDPDVLRGNLGSPQQAGKFSATWRLGSIAALAGYTIEAKSVSADQLVGA